MDFKVGDLIYWKHAIWKNQFLIVLSIKLYNEASIENGWDMTGKENYSPGDTFLVYLQKPDRSGRHYWNFERREFDAYLERGEMEMIT